MGVPRKRILVVDDWVSHLEIMDVLLTAEGFDVTTADSVGAAELALATLTPDLIISDVLLPGQPPFAMLDFLARREDTRRIPVLLCTAAVREVRDASERLEREGIGVVVKPFEVEELLSRVAELFQPRAGEI